ncbi:HK97 family phage prohead protease [uncultured Varibaculum sp.]|uniref:HK97 family phage prohead protease n=1 Tax=uncultured Varibaculum sp. TaxID=413896 RepID=UPI00205F1328|nr:HK97 family phage prohead protease [uncultured Varibaculum sp.]DAZ27819.1 MAG TPA: head maturation protease [Caudoviricetes sp.]
MTNLIITRAFTSSIKPKKKKDEEDEEKDPQEVEPSEDENPEGEEQPEDDPEEIDPEEIDPEDEDEEDKKKGKRSISGLAVPFYTPTEIMPGFSEQIAPGAITPNPRGVKLFWQHREPIGAVTQCRETPKGLVIDAKISNTTAGRDAYELVKDGAISQFSIGFRERDYIDDETENGLMRTQLGIDLMEVSLVPFPAYEATEITEIRAKNKGVNNMKDEELTGIRADIVDLKRALAGGIHPAGKPAQDRRSIGQVLKAIAAEDKTTIDQVNALNQRADNATVTSDAGGTLKPAWVGFVEKLVDDANPLAGLFASGTLPASGMSLEYGVIKENTVKVEEQTAELENLAFGKVKLDTKTAPIKTFGGYTRLSRQAIERSPSNLLNITMQAMAIEAGKRSATYFAEQFATAVKGRAAAALSTSKKIENLAWGDLSGLILDAAAAFQDKGLNLDALVVDPFMFKRLATLTTPEDLLMTVNGKGANQVGEINLTSISGNLAGLKVVPDLKATKDAYGTGIAGAFVNFDAMRTYKSGNVQLQDENIINLSKDFSVYFYQASVCEDERGIIPLKVATA